MYQIDFEGCLASCDHPQKEGLPVIMFNFPVKGNQKTLELLIHEALHACDFKDSEEKVSTSAQDIARFLWRVGYRLRGK
ncbi:MAG: hypothetical protein LLF76_02680 [Planctomycetaceae bacterium]|nr:hypothetical protein [Planctomycetaceae bacterium]